jgi:hypothetical protein
MIRQKKSNDQIQEMVMNEAGVGRKEAWEIMKMKSLALGGRGSWEMEDCATGERGGGAI